MKEDPHAVSTARSRWVGWPRAWQELDHPTALLSSDEPVEVAQYSKCEREKCYICEYRPYAATLLQDPNTLRRRDTLGGNIEVNAFEVLRYHLNAPRLPRRCTCGGVSLSAAESRWMRSECLGTTLKLQEHHGDALSIRAPCDCTKTATIPCVNTDERNKSRLYSDAEPHDPLASSPGNPVYNRLRARDVRSQSHCMRPASRSTGSRSRRTFQSQALRTQLPRSRSHDLHDGYDHVARRIPRLNAAKKLESLRAAQLQCCSSWRQYIDSRLHN
jgi:hypothetical protein